LQLIFKLVKQGVSIPSDVAFYNITRLIFTNVVTLEVKLK